MGCAHNLTLRSDSPATELSFDEKLNKIQRYLPKGLIEKVLSQKDKIEGERKQVTVMFCDMKGFTPLVESLGPEKAYYLMDQVYEILIHQVQEYEGTVNELTGDGIMALFGAPIALEDAPQRALRSALSIHREMARFSDQHKGETPVRMRIGVHTGPVVVGTLGNDLRVEFKAVGDTVNLASRMEGLAEPGSTYVTGNTFKLTQGLFQFEALGEKAVKGKEGTIQVYKLLSSKKDVYRPRLGSERMIYSEMVGRDKELDRLEFQVMKAINGEGSIVNIIGEAGIGKSRLVAELKGREVMKRVTHLEGRAISIGRNLPFHPIIDLLKHWARIREGDGEATAFEKLEAAVKNVCHEQFKEVLPFVATLMGMKLFGRYAERVKGIEGEALEKLIMKNVRDLLIKATELTPLVIVAEDLHWADTSTIELMESLFRLAEEQKILFVNVFRPGHKETGDLIVETIKDRFPAYYVEIAIKPLDEKLSEMLISNMMNITGLHYSVIDQVVKRADGNPFFIEEVVRSFIDEGAVVLKDGAYEVTEKIGTMVIPHTINDVLMARIDRLEEKTRSLVKLASVIGRNFFYRILAEVANTIKDIDDRLSYLRDIQLIRERKRMEELEYLFKHALAQEAAYESILSEKRKELHLKVADSIQKVFAERLHEFYGMLAYHYSCGENEDKAEEYMIKAGEEALRSSASSEALHYYQEALRLYLKKHGETGDPEKLAMFEKNIAIALHHRGQYGKSVEHFDKALTYYGEILPRHPIAVTLKLLVCFAHVLISLYFPFLKFKKIPIDRDKEYFILSFKKLQSLTQIAPKRFFVEGFYMIRRLSEYDLTKIEDGAASFSALSTLFSYSGLSFRLSKKALEYPKDKVDKGDVKVVLSYELSVLFHSLVAGDWDGVKECNYDLINQNLNLGEFFNVSLYLIFHTWRSVERGCFSEAQAMIDKASDIADVYEFDYARGMSINNYLLLLGKYGKLHQALSEIENGIEIHRKIGQEEHIFWLYNYAARIQIMLRDVSGAEEALKHVREALSGKTAAPMWLGTSLRNEFMFCLYRLEESIKAGDKIEISKYRKRTILSGRKAVKISRKYAPMRTEVLRQMGTYYWLIGKKKKAIKWWGRSIEEGECLGARLELSRTYFEIGKRLLEEKSKYQELKGVKTEEYLGKARSMFKEMDLQWDLDQLERIAA
jgi:class 3 adenylate cyclase/tetratricopeptide (TPR) repeat protein